MKTPLLFTLIFFSLVSYGQITFEEVSTPEDFSIFSIRKSPQGEYFIQAIGARKSIYTSMNAQDWEYESLPIGHSLEDIQFFNDGTPLLTHRYDENLIRRNGSWHILDVNGPFTGEVDASFIKEDTLFVCQNNSIAYSIDKGLSFTNLFTYSNSSIPDEEIILWKFEKYFILYHFSYSTGKQFTIFNESGEIIDNQTPDLSYVVNYAYNSCGEILIKGNYNYYLIKDDLSIETGALSDIMPYSFNGGSLFSYNGNYYSKVGNTVFQTNGCEFIWEPYISNNILAENTSHWMNETGDVLVYSSSNNYFNFYSNVSPNQWEDITVNIHLPYPVQVNESYQNKQVMLTPNAIFHKSLHEYQWTKIYPSASDQIEFSPNGGLYVNNYNEILYSEDGGINYTNIELPSQIISYEFEVLDDNILIVGDLFFSLCHYSINNGADWISVNLPFNYTFPTVRLVDNYIFISDLDHNNNISAIDINSGEVTFENVGNYSISNSAILENGIFYFYSFDIGWADGEIYQYQYGESSSYISEAPPNIFAHQFITSGNELYCLGWNDYYLFDGETFTKYDFIGLPSNSTRKFVLSDNKYLYAIVDNYRIFRSISPLSYPQYISGHVVYDSDFNCLSDSLDVKLQQWQIKVESEDYLRIHTTNNDGYFEFSIPHGNYTLSNQPINTSWELCEPSFNIAIDENNTNVNQDFQAKPLVDCAHLTIDFSTPLLRRCFDNYYSVKVRNTGPLSSEATTLLMELDSFFTFTSASIPYTQIDDSLIEFELGALSMNEEVDFKIYFNLSCDADLGATHCLTGTLHDENICPNARPMLTECQENIGSYDPNDKRIFNEDGMEVTSVDKGEYIYYHIRFQNTGTDTAFTVRIVDPLSPILDLNTLDMLSASHAYEYSITDGPALEVVFENILLPDSSTNEVASHGFFRFKIRPLPEFDYGTSIPNQAAIYFDFNEAVITNEATLLILDPTGTREKHPMIDFSIFPNPTHDKLLISIEEPSDRYIDSYEIVNQFGQTILQFQQTKPMGIDVSNLTPGMYQLILRKNGAIIGMKQFVKI